MISVFWIKTRPECISLGGAFGLAYPNLIQYPDDVVAAWLRKQDNQSSSLEQLS